MRLSSLNFGNLPRTWARVLGPNLAAQPDVFASFVSLTSSNIFINLFPFIYYGLTVFVAPANISTIEYMLVTSPTLRNSVFL